jgi:hypothetical protein
MTQARSYREWLTPASLLLQMGLPINAAKQLHTSMFGRLLSNDVLYRIYEGGELSPSTHYTVNQYLNDLVNAVFRDTRLGKSLNRVEQDMQRAVVQEMIYRYTPAMNNEKKSALAEEYDQLFEQAPSMPCSHYACQHDGEVETDSFTRMTYTTTAFNKFEAAPYMLGSLKKIQALYQQARANATDSETRNFYDYQLLLIKQALEVK